MKKAFTMLELIFVIIVIGIIAAVVIPRSGSNKLAEAATQLLSHIRYTQHLAMVDDKFNPNDLVWYKKRWQILFGTSAAYTDGKPAYTIFADTAGASTGDPDIAEIAKNPIDTSRLLSGGYAGILYTADSTATKEMNLGYYEITAVDFSPSCSVAGSRRVAFDHLGRPMKGDLSSMTGPYSAGTQRLITQTCNITLTDSSGSIVISIEPETGYAHIN